MHQAWVMGIAILVMFVLIANKFAEVGQKGLIERIWILACHQETSESLYSRSGRSLMGCQVLTCLRQSIRFIGHRFGYA